MQGQRAGPEGQTAYAYPQVWRWKEPGLTNVCSTLRSILTSERDSGVIADSELVKFAGMYEAGSALSLTLRDAASEHGGCPLTIPSCNGELGGSQKWL